MDSRYAISMNKKRFNEVRWYRSNTFKLSTVSSTKLFNASFTKVQVKDFFIVFFFFSFFCESLVYFNKTWKKFFGITINISLLKKKVKALESIFSSKVLYVRCEQFLFKIISMLDTKKNF